MLNFNRKRMGKLLKRDERLIFSKIQKHINNLESVSALITQALLDNENDIISLDSGRLV